MPVALPELTGTFGSYLVIERCSQKINGNIAYKCRCVCGSQRIVLGSELRRGRSSCNKCQLKVARAQENRIDKSIEANLIDLTTEKYGRLQPLSRSDKTGPNGAAKWLCQCECGKFLEVMQSRLRNGKTKSCGCLARQLASERMTKMNSKKA